MNTEQILLLFIGGLLPLSAIAYFMGRGKAVAARSHGRTMHSQPEQYGWFTVVAMALPAIVVGVVGAFVQLLGVMAIPAPMLLGASLFVAAAGLTLGVRTINPRLRARNVVEQVVEWLLLAAALVSILTTFGIVISVLFESIRFFNLVSFWEFVTGTEWDPDAGWRGGEHAVEPKFGAVPLFAGTFMITAIALGVAIPIGLLSAIYMSEYASRPVRSASKPILEILAGIPTVVYGFFAAITVAPAVVDAAQRFGLDASYTNALAPGLVMGVMIIPFISSLSDDVINSVPQSMREGSLALGTTTAETVKHVLLPAALPGIVSAALLGMSRALGETMIVVMAAGLQANLTWNPLEAMTTVTVRIVDALTGDQAFDNPETLSAFGLGLVLFVVTLMLNVISSIMVRRFRQKYEA